MKGILAITLAICVQATAYSQTLRPLSDMSSASVPTEREAETIVLKRIMATPEDGLSATESVVAKLSFSLGSDLLPFGKKGDLVWQVHRVTFAETTSILWVNAETKAVRIIYPQKEGKAEPVPPPDRDSAALHPGR